MSLFKFGSIGVFQKAINNPRVRATAETKNGYAFKITDNYTAGGSKSTVAIVVTAGTIADGTLTFEIGGQTVFTTIVALTQNTAAKCAALIKTNLDAVLLGLGYTVAIDTATITVTAPTNSSSTASLLVSGVLATTTTLVLTPAYTAGTDAVTYAQGAAPFTNVADIKAGQVYVAMNIIDTPELLNQADYKIAAGEYVNAFQLNSLVGHDVEISSDLVTTAYASVAVGNILIPVCAGAGAMKWVKTTDTGYTGALKVVEKTTFGGTGFYCKIIAN